MAETYILIFLQPLTYLNLFFPCLFWFPFLAKWLGISLQKEPGAGDRETAFRWRILGTSELGMMSINKLWSNSYPFLIKAVLGNGRQSLLSFQVLHTETQKVSIHRSRGRLEKVHVCRRGQGSLCRAQHRKPCRAWQGYHTLAVKSLILIDVGSSLSYTLV